MTAGKEVVWVVAEEPSWGSLGGHSRVVDDVFYILVIFFLSLLLQKSQGFQLAEEMECHLKKIIFS